MNVEFREATTEDIDRICTVNRASIEELADRWYDEEQVSAWIGGIGPELYPIESADTYFLVAEVGDEIVGFGWTKPDADEYFDAPVDGEITGMYVHPSVAGNGVGSRLYERLETFAREQDVGSLGLWASLNAIAFYEKQGYERVTKQTLDYEDGVDASHRDGETTRLISGRSHRPATGTEQLHDISRILYDMSSPSLPARAIVGFVVAFGVSVALDLFVFDEAAWKVLTSGVAMGVGIATAIVLVERVL